MAASPPKGFSQQTATQENRHLSPPPRTIHTVMEMSHTMHSLCNVFTHTHRTNSSNRVTGTNAICEVTGPWVSFHLCALSMCGCDTAGSLCRHIHIRMETQRSVVSGKLGWLTETFWYSSLCAFAADINTSNRSYNPIVVAGYIGLRSWHHSLLHCMSHFWCRAYDVGAISGSSCWWGCYHPPQELACSKISICSLKDGCRNLVEEFTKSCSQLRISGGKLKRTQFIFLTGDDLNWFYFVFGSFRDGSIFKRNKI